MKRVFILLMTVAAFAAGCDKPQPQPRQSRFDRKVDGTIPLPAAKSGKSILMGTGLPYTPPRSNVSAVSQASEATAQVKAIMKEMVAAMEAGQSAKVLAYLPAEHAKLVKPIFDMLDSTTAARVQVERLIVARFGEPYVKRMRGIVMSEKTTQQLSDPFHSPDVEKLSFEAAGDKVTVRDPEATANNKPPMMFILTSGHWQMHMPDLEEPMAPQMLDPNGPIISIMKKMGNVEIQVFSAIGQGIQNGTISAENFDSRLMAIKQEKTAQLMAEMQAVAPPTQAQVAPQMQPQPAQPPGGNRQETELEMQMKVHTSLPGMP